MKIKKIKTKIWKLQSKRYRFATVFAQILHTERTEQTYFE
ncbi:MAG: hypothetical protein RLZZ628_1486 [Bacteroidota bacterium]|jgi:hypothetical protein